MTSDELVESIGIMCDNMTARPEDGPRCYTSFDSKIIPDIPIHTYIHRIVKFSHSSLSCLIVAMIFIDRLLDCFPGVSVTCYNIHRLYLTAYVLAVKYMDDTHYNNQRYADIGGITLSGMNELELDFCFYINFQTYVDHEDFEQYVSIVKDLILQNRVPTTPLEGCC